MHVHLRSGKLILLALVGLACLDGRLRAEIPIPPSPIKTLTQSWGQSSQGRYIPSRGPLHVLVVFVQFPDDRYDPDYPLWPIHQPPAYLHTFVDPGNSKNSSQTNLSDYFRVMSLDQFHLTGESFFVITPHTRRWYLDRGYTMWEINQEVLKELDRLVDFSRFDRWDFTSGKPYRQRPDGWVDMTFMIYRNVAEDLARPEATMRDSLRFYGGTASLGYNWYNSGSPDSISVDNGRRWFGAGWPGFGDPGRGTTSVVAADEAWALHIPPNRVQIHELAHFFLGDNSAHTGGGFWAMLNQSTRRTNAAGFSPVNAWERTSTGWIEPKTISLQDGNRQTVVLTDYLTTGNSVRVKLPGTASEFFLLEFHAGVSAYDLRTERGEPDNGLFVLHNFVTLNPSRQLRLVPADGRWNWQVSELLCGPGRPQAGIPVFQRLAPNPASGQDDCSQIHFTMVGVSPCGQTHPVSPAWIQAYLDPTTDRPVLANLFYGDGNDAFTRQRARIFSPWSNPGTWRSTAKPTGITIEVLEQTARQMRLAVYFGSEASLTAPPSRLQDVRLTASALNSPRLTWTGAGEPDFQHYEIWRKQKDAPYEKLQITTRPQFQENAAFQLVEPGGSFEPNLFYRVIVVDASGQRSLASNEVPAQVEFAGEDTTAVQGVPPANPPLQPGIDRIFPNPVNGTAQIEYTLARAGEVLITAYNVLGQQVATVLSARQGEGKHRVVWTPAAAGLSSGVYFLRLQSQGVSAVRKIWLVK